MRESICDAIKSRAVLVFFYDGGERVVEPHCHGISTAGHEVLRAYQVSGFSRSSEELGWRLFDVDKMGATAQNGQTFAENRSDYNPQDPQMTEIHCRV
jgi:hypothetical protein